MDWRERYRSKCVTASEALAATITSGCRVFLTGNCGVPAALVAALVDYAPQVRDVELVHVLTVGPAPWAAPEMAGHLRANIMFVGSNVRPSVWEGRSDFTPLLLSEFPTVFRRGGLPLDVALAHLQKAHDLLSSASIWGRRPTVNASISRTGTVPMRRSSTAWHARN